MKKVLIICLFLIVFLVGCGKPQPPEVVIDYIKVGEVTDSMNVLECEKTEMAGRQNEASDYLLSC